MCVSRYRIHDLAESVLWDTYIWAIEATLGLSTGKIAISQMAYSDWLNTDHEVIDGCAIDYLALGEDGGLLWRF